MRRGPPGSVRHGAVIAVAALYALLLQAFLGALQPLPALGTVEGVLCAEHQQRAPADDGQTCARHDCCLPARHAELPAFLPAPSAVAQIPAPPSDTARPLRPVREARGPRAPPDPAIGPRGPPSA